MHVQEVAGLIGQCETDGDGLAVWRLSDGHLYLRLKHSQTPQPPSVPVYNGTNGVLNLEC